MTEREGLSIENLTIAFAQGRKEAISNLTCMYGRARLSARGRKRLGQSLTARAALGLLPRHARVGGGSRWLGSRCSTCRRRSCATSAARASP